MGAGQFCTNPSIAVLIDGPEADAFAATATSVLSDIGAQTMLTDGMAAAYRSGRNRVAATMGVQDLLTTSCDGRTATPFLYRTDGDAWLSEDALGEEVFGPLGLIVTVKDEEQMRIVAQSLKGQLTCTIHMDRDDTDLARGLLPTLERKAGRILCNGFPTGVEVSDTMVHGGPYPASTNFGATSVGTMSIRRWLRPVCFQNLPDDILPSDVA